jgi:hypothetical protein
MEVDYVKSIKQCSQQSRMILEKNIHYWKDCFVTFDNCFATGEECKVKFQVTIWAPWNTSTIMWTDYMSEKVHFSGVFNSFVYSDFREKQNWIFWGDLFGPFVWKNWNLQNILVIHSQNLIVNSCSDKETTRPINPIQKNLSVTKSLGNANPVVICQTPSKPSYNNNSYLTQKRYDWLSPKFRAVCALIRAKDYNKCEITTTAGESKELSEVYDSVEDTHLDMFSPDTNFPDSELDNLSLNSNSDKFEPDPNNSSASPECREQPIPKVYEFHVEQPYDRMDPTSSEKRDTLYPLPRISIFSSSSRPFSSLGFEHNNTGSSDAEFCHFLKPQPKSLSRRRGSEPNQLPKLPPPKITKTPPGFTLFEETRFWAVRNLETDALIGENERKDKKSSSKRRLKLKEIPPNRSRSAAAAVDKSTISFLFDSPKSSPLFFTENPSIQVSPKTNHHRNQSNKSLHEKMRRAQQQQSTRPITHGGGGWRRKMWNPLFRNILKRQVHQARVSPLGKSDELMINFVSGSVRIEGWSKPTEKTQNQRKHSPWLRFLRGWNIKKYFTKRRKGFKKSKNKVSLAGRL